MSLSFQCPSRLADFTDPSRSADYAVRPRCRRCAETWPPVESPSKWRDIGRLCDGCGATRRLQKIQKNLVKRAMAFPWCSRYGFRRLLARLPEAAMSRGGAVAPDVFLFEGFRFDRGSGELIRLDQVGNDPPVALGARATALLGLLVERHGRLVSKDAIMDVVWHERVVEEANLTV